MTTPEATLAQPLDFPADLDPPPSRWLPLTAADVALVRGEQRPEHGWPAKVFIFLANLTSFGLGAGAVGSAIGFVIALLMGEWTSAGLALALAVGLALGCMVQHTLAKSVSRFTRWGWYGAMIELAFATLAKVNAMVMDPTDFVGPAIGIAIDLLWMSYFWERRADFDIDLSV